MGLFYKNYRRKYEFKRVCGIYFILDFNDNIINCLENFILRWNEFFIRLYYRIRVWYEEKVW